MRLQQVLLLAAAGLLGSVEALDSELNAVHSFTTGQSYFPAKRFLRTDTKTEDPNEERGFPVSGLEEGANLVKLVTPKVAKKAQLSLLDVRGRSVDAAFAMLKLDEVGDNLLGSPQFKTWVSYVTSITKEHPRRAIVSTLATRYGDDVVVKMLETAKKIEGTKEIATKLQAAQMGVWLRKGKSVDDIFELLKLDDGLGKILANPNLDIWVSYMNFFNKQNPGKEVTTVGTFTTFYGDEAVSRMLEAAKKVPSTEKLAKEMQVAQFNQWLMEGAQPAQIGKMFKLTKKNLATNPDADIWHAYRAFYKAHE